MNFSIICDFDGTIALQDTTDLLLEHYADAKWHDIEQQWEQGKIGSAECMRQQVALVEAQPGDVERITDTVKIDPYFAGFIRFCVDRGVPFIVASDGIDFLIKSILQKNGMSELKVIANKLNYLGGGKYRLDSPFFDANCRAKSGVCKCDVLAKNADKDIKKIFIGDGRSDFCVAKEADIVLATGKLKIFCEEQKIQYFSYDNFNDVQNIIALLIK